jgi:hypothetical protein
MADRTTPERESRDEGDIDPLALGEAELVELRLCRSALCARITGDALVVRVSRPDEKAGLLLDAGIDVGIDVGSMCIHSWVKRERIASDSQFEQLLPHMRVARNVVVALLSVLT